MRDQVRAIANSARYGSQKQTPITKPNRQAVSIMKAVNTSERKYCMRSARQTRQVGDAAEQRLHVAQQREAVVAPLEVLVHDHHGFEKRVDRRPQGGQQTQGLRVFAEAHRARYRAAQLVKRL